MLVLTLQRVNPDTVQPDLSALGTDLTIVAIAVFFIFLQNVCCFPVSQCQLSAGYIVPPTLMEYAVCVCADEKM